MAFVTAAMHACSSSRFAPLTRTVSPCMEAWTLSFESLINLTIFFANSDSIPILIFSSCLTLLPDIFWTA